MATKLVSSEKYTSEIYSNESFFADISRDDALAFDGTHTFDVEIVDVLTNTIIDTEAMSKSGDSLLFEVRYFNTSSWVVGKKYKLLGRLKDTATLYNDVVLEVVFTVV